MMRVFSNLFYIERKNIRIGVLLWEIVRFKINNIMLSFGYLLYKVVFVVVFWLRFVRKY